MKTERTHQKNNVPFLAAGVATVLLLTGCQVGPEYQTPKLTAPAQFNDSASVTVHEGTHSLDEWWNVFDDSELNSLIRDVREANLDLRLARARVLEARAQSGVVGSSLFPQINANGSYTRSRLSENSLTGKSISIVGEPLENNLFEGSFDMSWEIDIFGGRQRANEAAQADFEATVEAGNDVLVSVLAETGLNYFELRTAQKQLTVARANLQSQEQILSLVRKRFNAGIASELDVSLQEAQVADLRAQIAPFEERERFAIHRLSVLAGNPPATMEHRLLLPRELPLAVPRVPVGLPSDLLGNRPDLRRAERELAAATARIGEATAELYPRFYLTGAAGLQSIEASNFFTGGSRFWSLGPGLQWPVFDAGRIRQSIRVENARQEQAAIQYEQTFLRALEEVENALVGFGKEQQRHQALKASEAAQQRSLDLAGQQYRSGIVGFLNVLEAERSLHVAQSNMAQSEGRLYANLVRLYKSLGGGWDRDSMNSPEPSPGEHRLLSGR